MMADVSPDANSGAAGTEYQTAQALQRLGQEVETLWGDSFPHHISHGNLHYLLELPFAYRKTMQARLAAKRYDVIHVNQPHGYLAAKEISNSKGGPVFIHRSHGFELRVEEDLKPWREKYGDDPRPVLKRLASRIVAGGLSRSYGAIARFADGHIVSASQCRDFLHERMGVPRERIAVIPQAAADSFIQDPAPVMTPKRLTRVLYVGQFAFFKAPMIVAEVMNRLTSAAESAELTWVCSKEHHSQVRQMLNERARDRVHLLDWMTQDDLVRVYDEHGIFLFPSFFEGFGKVFLEAMSRGLCVVAADNSGAHDVITHEADGLLAPTGDIDAMTGNCLRLMQHPDEAIVMSRVAAETARTYTWDRVGSETAAFYEDRIAAKIRKVVDTVPKG